MNIGKQIKNYRKNASLTQEQVATYLGVSTPAVNKWEKGNTYPDISLLPALARLLKIDMNELFSFREELTETEIGLFVNELSEISLTNFTEAFEMGKSKIQEYPHCDLLIYSTATILNSTLLLSDVDDEKKSKYNTESLTGWNRLQIVRWKKCELQVFLCSRQNISKWNIMKMQVFF